MRSLTILLLLIMAGSLGLSAQNSNTFETISVENAGRLVEIRTWTDTNGDFSPATFSPDGSELAIALNNGRVEFISMETMDTVRVIDGIETEAEWLNYSSDGSELLIAKRTGIYTLINVNIGAILAVNKTRYEEDLFSPTADVRKYARWNILEGGVSIHDTLTGDELLSVEDADTWRVSYDGTLLLTRNDDLVVQIRDIETGEAIFSIVPPDDNVSRDSLYSAGFTPEGLVWTTYPQFTEIDDRVTWHGPIQFWDITTGEIVLELEHFNKSYHPYSSLIFDPTNTHVLARELLGLCWIWELATSEQLPCPTGGNDSATFSADGRLIAVNSGTSPNVNIYETGEPRRLALLETAPTYYVEFSPDGKFLVTIDQHIHLWAVPSEGE